MALLFLPLKNMINRGDIMAYQMQYVNVEIMRTDIIEKKKPRKKMILIISILALAVGIFCIPEVRQWLIPGNAEVTRQAADNMIRKIQSGGGVVDAFSQFCQQILQNS